jgi:hypothetical protein
MSHIGTPGGEFTPFLGIMEGDKAICRKCMSHEETINAVRGFADKILSGETFTCSKCDKKHDDG